MFDYKAVSMNQDEFTQSFVSFFKERPSFCVTKMAHEIGFDRLNLSKIIFGTRNIPRAKRGIFHNFMSKYGLKHGVPKRTTSRKHEAKKSRQKEAKAEELAANKLAQKQLQEQKTAYLQSLDLPFNTMTIDDDGGLLMDGTPLCEPYKSSGELWAIIPRIIAKLNPEFRYLFIQGWNMMDKTKQKNLVKDLLELGFQLCIEVVDETEDGGVIVLTEIVS